jgi:hypothetical protein
LPRRKKPTPKPAPPFMVQAERTTKQHTGNWCSDRVLDNLEYAMDDARKLHEDYGRKVRVIDQNEHVWLRLPAPAPRRRV